MAPVFAQGAVIIARPLIPALEGEYANADPPDHQKAADSFSVAQAFTLEDLTFYGRYDTTLAVPPETFAIRLYADVTGAPDITPLQSWVGSVMATTTADTYTLQSGATVPWIEYAVNLPGWGIVPGTYWLEIVEADAATAPVGITQWLWGDTGTLGPVAIRINDAQPWIVSARNSHHAFTLEGSAVPEPGSLLLLAVGLLGLATRKRIH